MVDQVRILPAEWIISEGTAAMKLLMKKAEKAGGFGCDTQAYIQEQIMEWRSLLSPAQSPESPSRGVWLLTAELSLQRAE